MRRLGRFRLSFLLSAASAGAVVLATFHPSAKAGSGLVGTQPGDLTGDGQFVDADKCASCHGGGINGDKSFLPSDTWAGTMMANAARDPVFFAALSVANQDQPGEGQYCLHCHSPIGFVKGHATPPDGSAFDAIDQQGVGCDTCHRMKATGSGSTPYVISDAQVFYDNATAKRGPYVQCDAGGLPAGCANSPAHDLVQEPNLTNAGFCGQCHDVTNPDRKLKDSSGVDTTHDFPLDTTYEEWLSSDFAAGGDTQTCQGCHMVVNSGDHPVATVFDAPKRTDAREHGFVGGNLWGIQAVMAKNPDRATKYADAFALAQKRVTDNLAAAVKVTMDGAPSTSMAGDTVSVKVGVENLTGHKFPTGYAETRRAWVSLVLVGEDNQETFLAGGYDDGTGEILTTPATHIYRAVHGVWDGTKANPDSHLVKHDSVVEDTRIPPKGFVPTETTQIIGGIDYSDGQGGFKNADQVSFSVTLPSNVHGKATLSARVYYQSMTKEHIDFLAAENTTDQNGKDLATIYAQTNKAPPIPIAKSDSPIDLGAAPTTTSSTGSSAGGSSSTSSSAGGAATSSGGSGGSGSGSDSSGCSCRIDAEDSSGDGLLFGAAAVVFAARSRRRRANAPAGPSAEGRE